MPVDSDTPMQSTSASTRIGLSLRASYTAVARGSEGLAHGPEFSIFLSRRREKPWLAAFLTIGYIIPTNTKHPDFTLRLAGARSKAGAALGQTFESGLGCEFGAAVGAEFIQFRTFDVTPDLTAQPNTTEVRPVTSLHVGVSAPVSRLRLALAFVTDIRLDRTSYVIQRQGATREVFSPWPIQPGLVLSLIYDFARQ